MLGAFGKINIAGECTHPTVIILIVIIVIIVIILIRKRVRARCVKLLHDSIRGYIIVIVALRRL